jgi:hypothetical protein
MMMIDDLYRYFIRHALQAGEQPVVLFNVPVKGWWQEGACTFNQSSNSCLQTMRYNRAPFSSFIQQQPL